MDQTSFKFQRTFNKHLRILMKLFEEKRHCFVSYNISNWGKILVAVIDKSKKRLSREVNPVEVSRGRPTVLIPGMLPVHQENSRESSSISSSVRSSSTSASSSTVAAAKGATAATATATAATKTSPAPTSKPAAQKDQRIPIVDLENVVNNNNKGNNKNEHEVNLSPEQEDKNYAKEMTTELEMFAHPAENNNGQNLQNNSSTTKGGKSYLLFHTAIFTESRILIDPYSCTFKTNTLALNFYRYKTFVVFKSVTFEIFQIFLQIIIDIKINTF